MSAEQVPMAAEHGFQVPVAAEPGFRGVRDDLSELGRHLLDIVCFISSIIAPAPAHDDSPPTSPRLFQPHRRPSPRPPSARVLAHFSCGLWSGLSLLSAVFLGTVPEEEEETEVGRHHSRPSESTAAKVVGVSEEVCDFVRDLVKCPESWLEFPVMVDDEFHMSQIQREHVEAMELSTPELADLRFNLCPFYISDESFWRIYFVFLNPKLSKHDSEKLSTQQIVDSLFVTLKGTQNRTRSQQNIDQYSEVKGTNQFKTIDDENLLMDKYMDSFQTETGLDAVSSASSSSRRKHVTVSDDDYGAVRISQVKMHSDAESSDWSRPEDSDFVMVDKKLA